LTDRIKDLNVEFSPAGFDDWDAVHALLVTSFAYMDGQIDPPSSLTKMNAENLREVARSDAFVVARDSNRIVGFGFGSTRGKALYLSKLAVHPDARNRGVLRRIVCRFVDFAIASDLIALTLQTRVELETNHLIFNALGFTKSGETRHPGFDRVTSLTFSKAL
jgi:N-acetylglutamate synthase-like GNAT family acetyltransferase